MTLTSRMMPVPSLLGKALAVRSQGGPPVPMGSDTISYLPGRSDLGGNADLTLIRAYKTNGTTFSNVALLASATASPEWKLYRAAPQDGRRRYTTADKGSDQRVEVVQHAALNLLNNPAVITVNGIRWPAWDRMGLFEISQLWMELTGKSYWVVDRGSSGSSLPIGLWPVRPDRVRPVPDRDNYLAGYVYTSPDGRERIPLLPTEVIVNKYPDPEDPYGGCGPIRSVLVDIEADRYSAEWNRNFFINSAEPGGVIQVDHELDDEEFNQLVDRWRDTHRGVARSHRVAVLEAGATWVPNTHSMKDMDFAALRMVQSDKIREALGMHKVMTGVTDDVNRANAQTGEEVFASWKVDPRLVRWRNVLNTQLLPLFGSTAIGVEWDYIYPMPQNREQDALELSTKSKAAQVLVDAGYDPDDVCEVVGLPKMKVAVRATQSPALPPAWVAAVPDAPAGDSAPAGGDGASVPDTGELPDPGADTENTLRRAAGWESPAWRHLAGQEPRRQPARPARRGQAPPLLNKEAAAKAFEQEAEDYPAHAIAWMHHAQWMGPVKVPIDHIEPDMKWMDGADPDHVQEFVERRQKGKKLKPVILVKTPSNDKLLLVDGHHRYLAEAELDEPIRAFIATVDADKGDWTDMHKYQKSDGDGAERGSQASQTRQMAAWNRLAGVR
jgi:HK97 family phage portal protein